MEKTKILKWLSVVCRFMPLVFSQRIRVEACDLMWYRFGSLTKFIPAMCDRIRILILESHSPSSYSLESINNFSIIFFLFQFIMHIFHPSRQKGNKTRQIKYLFVFFHRRLAIIGLAGCGDWLQWIYFYVFICHLMGVCSHEWIRFFLWCFFPSNLLFLKSNTNSFESNFFFGFFVSRNFWLVGLFVFTHYYIFNMWSIVSVNLSPHKIIKFYKSM